MCNKSTFKIFLVLIVIAIIQVHGKHTQNGFRRNRNSGECINFFLCVFILCMMYFLLPIIFWMLQSWNLIKSKFGKQHYKSIKVEFGTKNVYC